MTLESPLLWDISTSFVFYDTDTFERHSLALLLLNRMTSLRFICCFSMITVTHSEPYYYINDSLPLRTLYQEVCDDHPPFIDNVNFDDLSMYVWFECVLNITHEKLFPKTFKT